MDCSAPGLPVPHYLLEFDQVYFHWLSGAIQQSHLLLPSSFAFNLSQHQGRFQWVGCLHHVAKVLELQLQHQSFQWIFRVDFLYDWLVWSPCSARDSQESSLASQFKSIKSLVLSLLYGPTLTLVHDYWKDHSFDYMDLCWQMMSLLFSILSRFVIAFLPRNQLWLYVICSAIGDTIT